MPLFSEVVSSPDKLMGVKAVFLQPDVRVLGFGTRADSADAEKYFRLPKSYAEQSVERPFVVTIGGGGSVNRNLKGRVVAVVKVNSVYGETKDFIMDPVIAQRQARWPVSVGLHDIWHVRGLPHLIDDLGFKDRNILNHAFDTIVRREPEITQLWESLRGWELDLFDAPPLPHFVAPPSPTKLSEGIVASLSAEEGKRKYQESWGLERSSKLARAAKEANRVKNGGVYRCEACEYSDALRSMFDAHHLVPLAIGQRETVLSDFAVLCPMCHRIAHYKAEKVHDPLEITSIKAFLAVLMPKH